MLIGCLGNDIPLDTLVTVLDDADETVVPGFGVGWYAPDDMPAAYRSVMPAMMDANLEVLSRTLFSDCWLAQAGFGMTPAAPQPLFDDDMMAVVAFDPADWPPVRAIMREQLETTIEGELDYNDPGAVVFAFLRNLLTDDDDMTIEDAMLELSNQLTAILDGMPAVLSLLVCDGERLLALRRAWAQDCAPLAFTTACELMDGAQCVASQVLDDSPWQSIPPQHLLILDRERPPELVPA